MELELNWKGKDTSVDRISLPFQTVEKLTEKRILKQKRLDKWTEGIHWPENYPKDWRNRLIWGDNKYIMSSLLRQGFGGEIDLIYIDPPFATGADFSMPIEVGDIETTKEPSVVEKTAYRDTWGKGLSSYLQMMYERLVLMKDLLSKRGSVYVHCDWRVNSYLRFILNEIFGEDNFRNEIIWSNETASGFKSQANKFIRGHDTILYYSKSDNPIFNKQFLNRYSEATIRRYDKKDEDGRRYKVYYEDGEERRQYLDESQGKPILDVWTDLPSYQTMNASEEYLGFPTQKPEGLVKRIIKSSSNEGSLIADFFCGSGTTGAVAERLGRRWILTDLSKFAINTTRKRLLSLHDYSKDYSKPCRPFIVQNLGSYQKHKFIENEHPPVKEYRKFILNLYEAESVEGYSFVHGKRGNSFVHIGGVDSIVTANEVEDAVQECVNVLGGSTLDILGWDFELGLDKTVEDIEEMYGVEINLKQIPREATELKRVSDPDEIKFFDLNYTEVDYTVDGKEVKVEINDFVLANPEYIDEEVREKVENSTDWIDYWSVDFDYQGNVFHNMWQSFRTKNDRELSTVARHHYEEGGVKNIFVKVIDVFGNDTNSVFEVEI